MAYGPTLDETLARYAEAWSTVDPDARWSLVHSCAADDVTYVDPQQDRPVEGQAALAAFTGLRWEQTGGRFEWIGDPDEHHGWVRIPWRVVGNDGDAMTGLMVASVDGGRLSTILHFVDG